LLPNSNQNSQNIAKPTCGGGQHILRNRTKKKLLVQARRKTDYLKITTSQNVHKTQFKSNIITIQ